MSYIYSVPSEAFTVIYDIYTYNSPIKLYIVPPFLTPLLFCSELNGLSVTFSGKAELGGPSGKEFRECEEIES